MLIVENLKIQMSIREKEFMFLPPSLVDFLGYFTCCVYMYTHVYTLYIKVKVWVERFFLISTNIRNFKNIGEWKENKN